MRLLVNVVTGPENADASRARAARGPNRGGGRP